MTLQILVEGARCGRIFIDTPDWHPPFLIQEAERTFEDIPREWCLRLLLAHQKYNAPIVNPLDREGSALRWSPKSLAIVEFISNGGFCCPRCHDAVWRGSAIGKSATAISLAESPS
jgi:hypothetical protein